MLLLIDLVLIRNTQSWTLDIQSLGGGGGVHWKGTRVVVDLKPCEEQMKKLVMLGQEKESL